MLTTEFEIKCALDTSEFEERVLRFLRNRGDTTPVILSAYDKYYDTTQRDLFRQGAFLRVRNGSSVDIKQNPMSDDTAHVSCEETKFSLPLTLAVAEGFRDVVRSLLPCCPIVESTTELEGFLAAFGLGAFVTLRKTRHLWRLEDVDLCIDEVADLGRFLEIEARGEAGRSAMLEIANILGVENLPVGYVELHLRKHDWSTYMRGRYILAGDRVKAPERSESNGAQDA